MFLMPTTENELVIDTEKRMFVYFSGTMKQMADHMNEITNFAIERAEREGLEMEYES